MSFEDELEEVEVEAVGLGAGGLNEAKGAGWRDPETAAETVWEIRG